MFWCCCPGRPDSQLSHKEVRLRGEHPEGRGAYLIVIEAGPDEPRYISQGIGPATSAETVAEIYAHLHVHLARNIAHETAWLDGASVRTVGSEFRASDGHVDAG
jgi:hypothetical protein